ncbi:SURF1 family protein [Microbulbifer sp. THAF38]|uniref:SURF1 family protein n=1 Tax=Microbulbifer sp. THAF38 TaxID=2587856 RepID=UPI001268E76F|nr:SURF1 family protein [Microbulbifer sp. THAF38]QFT53007.1 SURF1 family protein [Microbulbifer sp. THAF38]
MTVEIPSVSAENTSVSLIRNWPITLFSIGLMPVFVLLGAWQLNRAETKQMISLEIDARMSAQPVNPKNGIELKRFLPVKLTGKYSSNYFLLDNRTRRGQVGYEVLQIFISGNQRWLVNRGWIPLPESRAITPEVSYPDDATTILGFIYPVEYSESLSSNEKLFHQRIQAVNRKFTDSLDLSYKAWTLRLSADSESSLVTDWKLINSNSDRHIAYAVQWFAMAVALFILWLLTATNFTRLCRNRQNNNT